MEKHLIVEASNDLFNSDDELFSTIDNTKDSPLDNSQLNNIFLNNNETNNSEPNKNELTNSNDLNNHSSKIKKLLEHSY